MDKCNHTPRHWMIDEVHPIYGTVGMMRTIDGEPYRFFTDKDGGVAMIPLEVLQAMDDETKRVK